MISFKLNFKRKIEIKDILFQFQLYSDLYKEYTPAMTSSFVNYAMDIRLFLLNMEFILEL